MIILGYSGLNDSVHYARRNADLRPGEERMVQGLDSAAALLVDGRVVAAAAEERFSGEKHTNAFPAESIRFCLDAAGISAEHLDGVAHGFNYRRYAALFRSFDAEYYGSVLAPERQVELWAQRFGRPPRSFSPVDHHLAHAASAYFQSGFDEALCLVADGMGEVTSLTIYAARGGELTPLISFPIKASIGILYSIVTVHLGFKFNADEYKVMGLAPYGDPARYRNVFAEITELGTDGQYELHLDRLSGDKSPTYRGVLRYLADRVISPPPTSESLPQAHCDFAAAVQECLETVLFHVLSYWRQRTGFKHLCYAGGVALNCTFNGKLLAGRFGGEHLFDDMFVQPAAGDDGSALGAAFAVARQRGEQLAEANHRELPMYGPAYTRGAIVAALERFSAEIRVTDLGSENAAAEDAARAIADDAVVAWFQGRMEYGPRALGNRSILANPMRPDVKERLNRIIKLREGFRPFAPAATAERAHHYFAYQPSAMFDYMLAICEVRPDWRARLPGITHVDGSARLQTVRAEGNPLFHRLITHFGEITGIHCVVNTSFNVRGQPMIVSPEIAIATFLKVRIDGLYLGQFRVQKRPQP
jgi:carbamoyltransferase